MIFSISTRWNAYRHASGETMAEEILNLGFSRIELGFDLRIDLVPGVQDMVKNGAVAVGSLHHPCPVPLGAPTGHPDLYPLTSLDRKAHERAVKQAVRTVEFAATLGAGVVVAHAGSVETRHRTSDLIDLYGKGKRMETVYEKQKEKLLMERARKAPEYLDALYRALDALLPTLQATDVRLALELLPRWESVPSEMEMEKLLNHFDSPFIRYWHDMGHGQTRQYLGLSSHKPWLERLLPRLAGVHVHDLEPPAGDHIMPPNGQLDFTLFRMLPDATENLVLEPAPGTAESDVLQGRKYLETVWG